MKALHLRFEEKIFHSPCGCWIWTGAIDGNKRARIYANNRNECASRVSYEIYKGPIGDLHVCHSCDNGLCVNPDHLWLGTQQDNIKDRTNKNRSAVGNKNTQTKLSEPQVRNIKEMVLSGRNDNQIARLYSVDHNTIRAIRLGKTWKSI